MTLEDYGWNERLAQQFAPFTQRDLVPARVIRGEKNYFRVICAQGELTVRFAGRVRHQAAGRQDLPVVGDWVALELNPAQDQGVIHAVLERFSSFARNLPGRRKGKNRERVEQQVIAANVETVLIVCGLDQDFNLRRIERYLTLVTAGGAQAVVVLNKADLCANAAERLEQVRAVAGLAPVELFCAHNPEQVQCLRHYLHSGQTLALLGSSGVGKSTIINALLGDARQKVAEVSPSVGKGRHTTTHRELFLLPGGGVLMDNPGMRELHLWGEEDDLAESFAEIEVLALNCRFSDCGHQSEPGCAVLAACEKGQFDAQRIASYLKLKAELTHLQRRR
ncbi:MAG: ribosome small subunit-dependent GTPase A [Deltaproteobacteria bacterium]|nr:ribosome small subunit-dependent GTPase A [Deltaproteobacteria bacterium]